MLTYVMSVPVEQCDEYVAHGWIFRKMDQEHAGFALVDKTVPAGAENADDTIQYVEHTKKPQYIQTGTIRRPLGKHRDSRFFDSVSLDHMGGDFPYDSLPASMRRMFHTRFAFETFKAENLFLKKEHRSYALRLYTRFRGVDLDNYVSWLIALRNDDLKMRRSTGFSRASFPEDQLPSSPDIWWDVQNDVIFSFDKNYMTRLPDHLAVSYSIYEGNYSSGAILRAS